jgi:acetyl-CoA carboxylase biotin carboxyl carrier protein
MDLNELQQLSTWLKASGLGCLELSRPGKTVKIYVSTDLDVEVIESSDVEVPTKAVPTRSSLIDVKTKIAGIFLPTHPMRETPFVSVGSRVQANSIVGLLKIGCIYSPVVSSAAGIVRTVKANSGDLLGYGETVLTLECECE